MRDRSGRPTGPLRRPPSAGVNPHRLGGGGSAAGAVLASHGVVERLHDLQEGPAVGPGLGGRYGRGGRGGAGGGEDRRAILVPGDPDDAGSRGGGGRGGGGFGHAEDSGWVKRQRDRSGDEMRNSDSEEYIPMASWCVRRVSNAESMHLDADVVGLSPATFISSPRSVFLSDPGHSSEFLLNFAREPME